jgi:hypothetical protein
MRTRPVNLLASGDVHPSWGVCGVFQDMVTPAPGKVLEVTLEAGEGKLFHLN